MGFTHVILGTGCQAYLGGLIEINDFASMTLMILFYRNLKRDPRLSLAESLRQAQLEFIQMDKRKATRFFDELLDRWDKIRHHEKQGRLSVQVAGTYSCPENPDFIGWTGLVPIFGPLSL